MARAFESKLALTQAMTALLFDGFQKGSLFFFLCDFFCSPFMGGSIIKQLYLQEGRPLWSAQITDNMQGMEMDGLYGLGSECVYWVDKMTGFSLLSLAFALLSLPHWIYQGSLLSLSLSHSDSHLLCFPLVPLISSSPSLYHIPTFIFYTSLASPPSACVSLSPSVCLPLLSNLSFYVPVP